MKIMRIPRIFKDTVEEHLETNKPKYKDGRFPISEKDLQADMAKALVLANLPFMREQLYTGQTIKIDFKVLEENFACYVEIEWEAKYTDGFAARTFHDLDKLDKIHENNWGMFLALNIGNHYQPAKKERITRNKTPQTFYISPKGRKTVLSKRWNKSTETDLIKCNSTFWRWQYPYDKKMSVTVLTCYGRYLGNKRWSAT